MLKTEYKSIIRYMYEHENQFVSSLELSNLLGLSSKTIVQYMGEIMVEIDNFGGSIESRTGLGYRLIIFDDSKFDDFIDLSFMSKARYISEEQENVHFMIQQFLTEETVKTSLFENRLFLTRRTISSLYREVENFISEFDLSMVRKSSQGNSVVGSEHNIRSCINYEMYYNPKGKITNSDFHKKYSNKDMQNKIYEMILSIQRRYSGNDLSHVDIKELSSALYVAHVRNNMSKFTDYDEDTTERFNKRNSYYMASDIVASLKEYHNLVLKQKDIIFTAIFIVARRSFLNKSSFPVNESYQECEILAKNLVNHLKEINLFKYIAEDKILIETLSLNLTQLITQSEYNLYSSNSIHRSSKSLQALLLSVQSADYLLERFNFKLVESQITYLAAIIYPYFGRYPFKDDPKRGLMISDINKSVSMGVSERLLRNFSRYIKDIDVVEVFELEDIDLSNYSYLFTSYPKYYFNSLRDSIDYIYVDTFFNLEEKNYIRSKLIKSSNKEKDVSKVSKEYLSILIDTKVINIDSCASKEEFIKNISIDLKSSDVLKFNDSMYGELCNYEKYIPFTVENNVVFLTPLKSQSKKEVIRVYIANKNIPWNDSKVRVAIYWDRGLEDASYQLFENESLSVLIYNTFSDNNIINELIKSNDSSILENKANEINNMIVGGGSSFK